uniref:Uncharacterized protein n=1 Tax=Candidatus Kentrum sp. FW TaxID=2126338 RepID=A0A450U483_9GAMM|nr:MAG: hypothetical protein BECKFW1821C_GA0114237_11713 [Candidatus Kentron sp. FW]
MGNSNIWSRLCALIVVIILSESVFAYAESAANELRDKNLITDKYDYLLNIFFLKARERGDIQHDFNINDVYDRSVFNVYVVGYNNAGSGNFIESIDISLENIVNNMVAVAPNVIIIGEYLLADYLLLAQNESFAMVQGIDSEERGVDPNGVEKAWAMMNYLRFGNLKNKNVDDEDHALSLAPMMAKVLEGFDSPELVDIYYYGLLFFIAHEVAHLNRSKSSGLIDIWKIINQYKRNKILTEEVRADDEARQVVISSLSKNITIFTPMSIISAASYLRDSMNIRLFGDLREVDTRDLFFTIQQRKCEPDTDNTQIMRLDHVNFIKGGYWNILPVLSENEYSRIRSKLASENQWATHEHHFFRTEKIMEDLKDLGFDVPMSPITPFTRFYKDVLHGRPYIGENFISGRTSLMTNDFLSMTEMPDDKRIIYNSPACSSGLTCKTGRLLGGYFDFVSDGNWIKYINLYFPIVRADWNSDNAEELIRKMATTLVLYIKIREIVKKQNIGKDEFKERVLEEYSSLREDVLLACGFYYKVHENESNVLEVSTVRSGSWIRLKLFPSGVNPFIK